MKPIRLVSVSLLCLCLSSVTAQEEDGQLQMCFKGFVDTYHAMRTEAPNDWMASRCRIRGELTMEKNHAGVFVSANAVYNSLLEEQSGFFLREAYIYCDKPGWDMRAGRQIITWGVADAVRITDIVSPMDFTEFLAQDYDDIRIPVNAVRLKYTSTKWSAEAVVIPVSSFYELPVDSRNPWAVSIPGMTVPYTVVMGEKPAMRFENIEYGGRVGAYLSGMDFTVSALRTWNKMPVFRKTATADGSLSCEGVYRRMTMIGADMSLPLGKFVLRAEAAEYLAEAQEPVTGKDVCTRNTTNALIGVDWYAGNDWQLGLQYYHKYINGDMSDVSSYRNTGMATVRLSKDLLRSTLKISTFAYVDVTNGGVYNRLSVDYAINDQIHVASGYDFFNAEKGQFAMYDRNSEVWFKLRYDL